MHVIHCVCESQTSVETSLIRNAGSCVIISTWATRRAVACCRAFCGLRNTHRCFVDCFLSIFSTVRAMIPDRDVSLYRFYVSKFLFPFLTLARRRCLIGCQSARAALRAAVACAGAQQRRVRAPRARMHRRAPRTGTTQATTPKPSSRIITHSATVLQLDFGHSPTRSTANVAPALRLSTAGDADAATTSTLTTPSAPERVRRVGWLVDERKMEACAEIVA